MNNNSNGVPMLPAYLVALLLVLSACERGDHTGSQAGSQTRHQASAASAPEWLSLCPDFAQTGKAPLSQNAQCGRLWVSENPQDPQSKKIALNVLRIPAVNPVPEPDPLVVIAGGPGQAAVVVAESMHSLFGEVRKNRDIIFVDQRGTGQSNPFPCEFERELGAAITHAEQAALGRAAVARCIATIKDYAAYYITPYAVQDLDSVRAALGYEKINLWGGSYGSRVVLEYIRRYPERTRASVIDGVAPVAMALPWSMEADALAALQAINQQCAATPACSAQYGDCGAVRG
jgi:pimeloyl-ACP methyl ester carboxylesterase